MPSPRPSACSAPLRFSRCIAPAQKFPLAKTLFLSDFTRLF